MEKNQERKVPEYVSLHNEVLKIGGDIKNHARRFIEAYTALKSMADLGGVPADPKDSTEAWLSALIDAKTTEIETLPLTQPDKEAAREKWDAVRSEAMQYVSAIQNALAAYPLQYVDGDDGLMVTNINELTELNCQHKVPEICQQHYDKFMAVYDALVEFRRFEEQNSICHFALWELLRKARNPQDFALGWVSGGFSSKPDQVYVQQIRAAEQW